MFDILWQHFWKMLQQLSFVGVHTNLFYWPSRVLGFSKKRGVSAHEISDFFVDQKIHGNFATSIFWADSMTSSLWIFLGDLMFFLSTKVWGEHQTEGSCFSMMQVGSKPTMALGAAVFWSPLAVWRQMVRFFLVSRNKSFVKEMGEVEDWRVDKFNVDLSI